MPVGASDIPAQASACPVGISALAAEVSVGLAGFSDGPARVSAGVVGGSVRAGKRCTIVGINLTLFTSFPMDDRRLPFSFRISELLPVARLLRASYVRDQTDFQDLLPEDYRPAFLKDFDAASAAVEGLQRSSVAVAGRQLVTQRIAGLLESLPQLLNRLEARVRRAEGLTVPAKKFGIEAVRRDRNDNEHEGLADSLRMLLQNIETNKAALLAKGQKPEENAQLQSLYDDLVQDSTTQGSGLSDQRLLTADNAKLFSALYAPIKHLLADGKSPYQTSDKTKVKDYTLRKILQQVRREQSDGTTEDPTDPKGPKGA